MRSGGSFTQRARREQIIEATIETVAEIGLERASLARIAERIGIAKGSILYHFTSRDRLIEATLEHVYGHIAHSVMAGVAEATSARAALRQYVLALVAHLDHNRHEVRLIAESFSQPVRPENADDRAAQRWQALTDIVDRALAEPGGPAAAESWAPATNSSPNHKSPTNKSANNEAEVLAISISGAIDALLARALPDPSFDLVAASHTLADLVDHLFDRTSQATPQPTRPAPPDPAPT